MAEKLEAENASWERTAKDLFAGAAGGIAQVLLGELSAMFAVMGSISFSHVFINQLSGVRSLP